MYPRATVSLRFKALIFIFLISGFLPSLSVYADVPARLVVLLCASHISHISLAYFSSLVLSVVCPTGVFLHAEPSRPPPLVFCKDRICLAGLFLPLSV